MRQWDWPVRAVTHAAIQEARGPCRHAVGQILSIRASAPGYDVSCASEVRFDERGKLRFRHGADFGGDDFSAFE
jgi:hypothetical protein